jgi:ATP-dependent Clp protease ATP-binding subunit ClpB
MDVFNILLQVLDDGRLTDNKGVTVDFKNTIIILTSNIGSNKIISIDDKQKRKDAVLDELKTHFRPEFLNRLDDIVIFEQLGLEAITNIVDIMFNSIVKKVEQKGIILKMTPSAKEYIAKEGFDPVYGARPLKRALYEIVEDKLADMILQESIIEGDTVIFDFVDNKITVEVKR